MVVDGMLVQRILLVVVHTVVVLVVDTVDSRPSKWSLRVGGTGQEKCFIGRQKDKCQSISLGKECAVVIDFV